MDLAELSDELFLEIHNNKYHLPDSLRDRINGLPQDFRKALIDRTQNGCTPMYAACRGGKVKIVDYLVKECGASIELTEGQRHQKIITPLYCASRYGQLEVVTYLVQMGCNVNALSDNCSTALRIACIKTNIRIVQYLIENGADIRKPCSYGITYLIDSAQSKALCRYLISKGADVNERNVYDETALHRAVQRENLGSIQLLLDHGADPYATNRDGEDALQLACIAGSPDIVNYFIGRIHYCPHRLSDAYLLLGSMLIFKFNATPIALPYWRRAIVERHGERNNNQTSQISPRIENTVEFTCATELEAIRLDMNALREQSCLIQERILGITHEVTLNCLFNLGFYYRRSGRFQTCVNILVLNLKVRTEKDTILHSKTVDTARAIVDLMLYLLDKDDLLTPRFEDVYATFQLLASNISEIQQLLTIKPVYKTEQLPNYSCMLRYICYLTYVLFRVAGSPNERQLVESCVRHLILSDVRCSLTQRTLLHLSLTGYAQFEMSLENKILPNEAFTRFLLECGAPVNAYDEIRSTPLHYVSYPTYYKKEIVRTLVEFGAHLDMPNLHFDRPSTFLLANPENDIPVQNYISLECLCANVIAASGLPYRNEIPPGLVAIVEAHSPSSPEWLEYIM